MKNLIFNGKVFEAETVSKTSTDIIGLDLNGIEVFAFRGISDFSLFKLQDENGNPIEFPQQEPTVEEYLLNLDYRLSKIELGV